MTSDLMGNTATESRTRDPWKVFGLLAVVQFMVVLDTGIVYVALPSIQRQMDFSPAGLAWVMDAYMLAFGGFMLVGGRAADLFGRRRVLLSGLALFAAASLACGLSQEAWQLVTSRALQGLGAAVVAPSALALITDLFTEGPDRHKAFGIWGGLGGLAGATGVLFGGLLTSIGWQWTFLVNVPVVLIALVAGSRTLPAGRPGAVGRVDLLGALTSSAGLCLALFAVLHGGASGWGDATTLGSFAGAAVLLGAFVWRQLSADAPLIPRMLFGLRNVVLGNAGNTATGLLMFGVFFVVSLYLQQVRHYEPLQAGLRTMPISVAVFIGSQVSIRLFGKISPVSALAGGLALQAVGLLWWGGVLKADGDILLSFLLPGMVWGLGLGAAIVAAFVVCTSGLQGPVQGAASGLVSTTLQVGGALGVAVLTTVSHRGAGARASASVAAHGQGIALLTAGVIALVAVPLMLWLRSTWRPQGLGEHGH
ncbi:MFS transporter [Streptomyces sp. NPDC047022]|uniref:MFS transporter n=1 Tax=Streptomyces sp. NPDC047022 TaxID=3155737 RepID=UPI0033F96A0F